MIFVYFSTEKSIIPCPYRAPLSHLTFCTLTKSNLHLANSLATVVVPPVKIYESMRATCTALLFQQQRQQQRNVLHYVCLFKGHQPLKNQHQRPSDMSCGFRLQIPWLYVQKWDSEGHGSSWRSASTTKFGRKRRSALAMLMNVTRHSLITWQRGKVCKALCWLRVCMAYGPTDCFKQTLSEMILWTTELSP